MHGHLLSFVPLPKRRITDTAKPNHDLGQLIDDLQLLAIHDPAALRVLARMAGRFSVKIRKAMNS